MMGVQQTAPSHVEAGCLPGPQPLRGDVHLHGPHQRQPGHLPQFLRPAGLSRERDLKPPIPTATHPSPLGELPLTPKPLSGRFQLPPQPARAIQRRCDKVPPIRSQRCGAGQHHPGSAQVAKGGLPAAGRIPAGVIDRGLRQLRAG